MARWLREGYPLALLALFWIELGPLQALRGIKPHDAWVQALDLAVFGVHWQAIWMDAMPAAWLSEAMHFGYLLYYFFLLIPPVAIAAVGGQRAFRSTVLAIMATYLTCFLFYLAFPVYGPHALAGETAHAAPGGLFHALVDRARATGDSPGTAFPSSHVAGAFTLAWLGWRWLGRGWGAVLVTLALAVALSTVYTRNHYAIDAVVGLLWILPLQGWLVPALERRWPGPADQRTATQPTASRLG
ncbi:MAG: phosphatase PAP2 family protein [Candidatus Eiseniibacteriota bacterium]